MNVNKLITQQLIDRLRTAEETGEKFYWIKPFAKGCPRTAVSYDTQEEYHGINKFLLDSSNEYLTYKKIQDINAKNGSQYRLRKGCHGHMVIYYKMAEVKNASGEVEIDPDTGEAKKKPILRYYTVFDRQDVIDQNGINLPSKFPIEQYDHSTEEDKLQLAMAKFNAIVKAYTDRYGVTIEEIQNHGTEAYFMPSKNIIRMPSKENFPNLSSYMATFFHELCHSTMIPLARKADEPSMKTYSFEELVAELGSAILMAQMNVPTTGTEENNLAYLQGWSSYLTEKNNALVQAASQAEKCAELIMSEFEQQLAYIQESQEEDLPQDPIIDSDLEI